MIVALDPNDIEAQATLGELLGELQDKTKKPEYLSEAIAIHHKVIQASANRVESYRSLWKCYKEKKEFDKVYCLATVLRYLKKSDEEEHKIYNFFSHKAPQVETMLGHQDVKIPFTRIFHLLYSRAPAMFLKEHKDVNLRKKEQLVDLARDRSLFCHNFRIAAKVLGGIDVELFGLREQDAPNPPGLNIELTKPTAVIAYRNMFAEDKKKNLLFYIGRLLAMTRAEFILPCVLPVRELDSLLQASCSLMDTNFKLEGDIRGIERARSWMKRTLTEEGFGMLKRPVSEYLKESKKFNLRRWVEAVEHSVNRAGFIVCNDLNVALDILGSEQSGLTPMRPTQKVRELLLYASSPEYFELRETVGLAVS
jgi:hypothetical protein